jgi:hypothetical protein
VLPYVIPNFLSEDKSSFPLLFVAKNGSFSYLGFLVVASNFANFPFPRQKFSYILHFKFI